MLSSAVDISDHVKVSLKLVGQLLCELLVEYKSLLRKIRELLLTDGIIMKGGGGGGLWLYSGRTVIFFTEIMALAQNHSIVEVTMLLCSQVGVVWLVEIRVCGI